jgi:hypothetical protein
MIRTVRKNMKRKLQLLISASAASVLAFSVLAQDSLNPKTAGTDYEMASYGCLHEWAGLLGNTEAADLLEEILDEEKAANEGLTRLAVAKSNEEALCESCDEDTDEAAETKRAKPGRGVRPVSASVR